MLKRVKRWYADTPRLSRHAGTELLTIVMYKRGVEILDG